MIIPSLWCIRADHKHCATQQNRKNRTYAGQQADRIEMAPVSRTVAQPETVKQPDQPLEDYLAAFLAEFRRRFVAVDDARFAARG
ncbi:MAG: hypothetical protein P4L46_25470 [Fimbriimonas sp.]|nr:hypothetical protein [Fimbriimonas sp.]